MHCEFPYFEDRPHIPIAIENGDIRVRFLPLLDTGADYSLFYRSDALRLGLKWDEGADVQLQSADGSYFQAKQFLLSLDIEGVCFSAPICFVENTRVAMPLLGRKGIFDRFIITLNEKARSVRLQGE